MLINRERESVGARERERERLTTEETKREDWNLQNEEDDYIEKEKW
jgi:hypothetical protein